MSFEKHSNFNKLANFSEVKFGENKPVLEVELNEMQQIQNEARADIIRDTMPSGFVTLGDIDYEYCANNDNQIKLKTESIAYVNGYRITIPKDTIIEIGESDKEREDLVFLEVWREAVNDIDTLTEYGGENNAVINNPIKDERYPVATSQRVALKYRIRVIDDFNFNKSYHSSVTGGADKYIGWYDDRDFSKAYAMGANPTLNPPKGNSGVEIFRSPVHGWGGLTLNDVGLWVAGIPNDPQSLNRYKTLDGLVYAIPMFRLLRKPNVGLCTPFEYKKIHNQLDPKKFAHLVGQENVEKVHSVNVKGATYTNLVMGKQDITIVGTGGYVGFPLRHTEVVRPLETNTDYLFIVNVKSNTLIGDGQYSLDFGETDPNNPYQSTCFTSRYFLPMNALGVYKFILRTKSSFEGVYCVSRNQVLNVAKSGNITFDYMIVKYEEGLDNVDLPYFEGVKSLGELDNNSITVENNLVEEGTYVPELQNHILPTHPEVTHVTWGEDVVIPPEVEIELKRGEEVIQTITQLPVKLETTGEEKLHVKTMKGRTLVNLATSSRLSAQTGGRASWVGGKLRINFANYTWSGGGLSCSSMIKPSTKYFVYVSFTNNCKFNIQPGHFKAWGAGVETVGHNQTYYRKEIITTKSEITTDTVLYWLLASENPANYDGDKYVDVEFMFIEYQEGMENWGLKYFEGMQSVKVPVLKTTGKNLFDIKEDTIAWDGANIKSNSDNTITFTPNSNNNASLSGNLYFKQPIKIKTSTKYTYSMKRVSGGNADFSGTINNQILIRKKDGTIANRVVMYDLSSNTFNQTLTSTFNFDDTVESIIGVSPIMYGVRNLTSPIIMQFQIEEGSTATSYEPYKSNILRTPSDLELRRIGDVKDELNYLTGEVTERIREDVINGSEIWNRAYVKTNTMIFYTTNTKPYAKRFTNQTLGGAVLCAEFSHSAIDLGHSSSDIEGIYTAFDGNLCLAINKSKLSTENVDGLKSWLSQNPITVQYLLETPITKKIGLSEDDYVGKSKVTYQLAEPLRKVGTYSDFIKGKTLYSNIGVEVLNGSENIAQRGETLENTLLFVTYLTDLDIKSNLIYSDKFDGTDISWDEVITSDKEFIRLYTNDKNALYIRILKSKLATQDVNGFKQWLQANPVTIYYVKANPVEIPLKEVSPLDVDFSLNRQFKRGYENYLKELPNGVKDVVENGKVKRILGFTKLNGSESWTQHSHSNDTHLYVTYILSDAIDNGNNINTLTNMFEPTTLVHSSTYMGEGYYLNGRTIQLRILKSRLNTPDLSGFKSWLQVNPLCVLYELSTPTTEELTEENCRYVPYMPLNSYVGSLYVADGINRTKFLTDFSPSEYEVQTYHRYFSNEFNVFEDTTLKKSPYGHKTYLEEVDGKYVEKFIAGLEKHEIEDLRHKVSLTGFDYSQLLQDSFLKLIKGELS